MLASVKTIVVIQLQVYFLICIDEPDSIQCPWMSVYILGKAQVPVSKVILYHTYE